MLLKSIQFDTVPLQNRARSIIEVSLHRLVSFHCILRRLQLQFGNAAVAFVFFFRVRKYFAKWFSRNSFVIKNRKNKQTSELFYQRISQIVWQVLDDNYDISTFLLLFCISVFVFVVSLVFQGNCKRSKKSQAKIVFSQKTENKN